MVIVEDAYTSAKYESRFSWLVELEELERKKISKNKSKCNYLRLIYQKLKACLATLRITTAF